MSAAETNGGIENRRVSALGISSLVCGIIAAAAALVFFSWVVPNNMEKYVWRAMWICIALSYIFGIAALVQRATGRRRHRLWWLALFGMAISTGPLVYCVIMIIALLCLGST